MQGNVVLPREQQCLEDSSYPFLKYEDQKIKLRNALGSSKIGHPDLCQGVFAVGRCWLQQL